MILNLILLVVGGLFLFYGIRKKLRFWIVVSVLILCLGVISIGVDYRLSADGNSINTRLPFVITNLTR